MLRRLLNTSHPFFLLPVEFKELAGELKRACGTGGAVVDGGVEIQGDLRDRVRDLLVKKGWTVKG